jgi:hypothetical protein
MRALSFSVDGHEWNVKRMARGDHPPLTRPTGQHSAAPGNAYPGLIQINPVHRPCGILLLVVQTTI